MKLDNQTNILKFLNLLAQSHDQNKGLDSLSKQIGERLNILRRQVKYLRKEGYDIPIFPDETQRT